MKRAVCLLEVERRENGLFVLAVSRKDNPSAFGLPGGKVDPGETQAQAVVREMEEETGLFARGVAPVFTAFDGEFQTTTFIAQAVSGSVRTTESGLVRWVPVTTLISGSAPFAKYNRALFNALGYL